MFGTIFLKDEASDELDDIDRKGRKTGGVLSNLGRIALKAGAGITAFASASAGAVAASAPLLAGVGGLVASFGAAGIGALAFGAVAMGALAPVIEGAENLTKAQQGAREELEAFQSFWAGFVKQFETPVFEIFGQALTMIKSILTGLAPTITNASGVITELFTGMNESINNGGLKPFFEWLETNASESLMNFATITGNVFNGFFGLMQAFTPIGASMEEGLVRLTEKFATWANSLSENPAFQNFIEYAKTNTPILLDILSNLWDMITGAIETLAPLGTTILGILQQLTDTFISWSPMFTTIVGYITDFANIINNNWSTVVDVVLALGAAVGSFLVIMKGLQIIGIINALMVAMRAGTIAATLAQLGFNAALWANPITWVVALIAGLIAIGVLLYRNWDTVKAKTIELWNKMKETWNLIKQAVSRGAQEIASAVKTKFGEMVSSARTKLTEMWNTAKQKFTDMVNSAREKMNDVKSKVTEGINNVKEFLSGIDLSSMGKDMIQGLINGIGSMAGSLVEKAKGVVSGAIEGAKALLGINSPSRVFMEIGEFTGQGMEIGLDKSKQGVENASKELAVVSAKSASETKTANGGSSESSLLTAVKTMLENFKVDLYMRDDLVGSAVAPVVSNRQGETISRKKFFAGGDKK